MIFDTIVELVVNPKFEVNSSFNVKPSVRTILGFTEIFKFVNADNFSLGLTITEFTISDVAFICIGSTEKFKGMLVSKSSVERITLPPDSGSAEVLGKTLPF